MKRLELHEAIYNRIEFLIDKSIVQETFKERKDFLSLECAQVRKSRI